MLTKDKASRSIVESACSAAIKIQRLFRAYQHRRLNASEATQETVEPISEDPILTKDKASRSIVESALLPESGSMLVRKGGSCQAMTHDHTTLEQPPETSTIISWCMLVMLIGMWLSTAWCSLDAHCLDSMLVRTATTSSSMSTNAYASGAIHICSKTDATEVNNFTTTVRGQSYAYAEPCASCLQRYGHAN